MANQEAADPGQQAQYLLYYDDLTGLYNRRFYNRAYAEQTKKAADDGSPLGMIMIDVDFFKSINDRFGHQSGDAVLSGVGGVINETVGMSGYPIRYAGDEFSVLMPGLSREECAHIAESLCENVRARPFKLPAGDRTVKITFSVGVAHFPGDTDDPAKLFESADHAAYIAKKNGRDRFVAYQAGVKQVLDPSTLYQFFPCSKLIGRDAVIASLVEHLQAPAAEARPWIFVGGVPGVGKTRLLLELRNRADTQRTVLLETVGLPARPGQPFGFIVDALGRYIRENPSVGQQLAGALASPEIATIARLIPDLSRHVLLTSTDSTRRDAADVDPVEPFSKMLGVLGHNRSLTILIDDFHLADQGTMQVVERLHATHPNVFMCFGTRDDPETMEKNGVFAQFLTDVLRRRTAHYLALEPFTETQVQAFVEHVLPDAKAHPALATLVYQKSRGVALFVEEILKLLVHSRSIRYEGPQLIVDVRPDQIPTDADKLLEVRAGQADEEVRLLMARAAVIGSDFDLSTLMMVEGRDEGYLNGILERARKAHIISETWADEAARISFVSVHTHAAFYRSLPEEERRKLHMRLGRMRERQYANQLDGALSELAYHFNRAGDTDRAQRYRKIVSELYNQFVGTAADGPVDTEAIKQAVGPVELPEDLLRKAVDIVGDIRIALQKQRLYGTDHLTRQGTYDKIARQLAEMFLRVDSVTYSEADRNLLVNGVGLPPHLQFGSGIVETFLAYDIRALTFKVGVRGPDVKTCLDLLGMTREEMRTRGGLARLLKEAGVETIVPNEKIFVMVGERDIVLKRTNMRDEVLIKEVDEGPTAAAPVPENLAAFEQWQREFARYADLSVLDGTRRDWRVLQRDLESANSVKILAASKVYADARDEAIGPLLGVIRTSGDGRAREVAVSLLTRASRHARDLLMRALLEAPTAAEKCALLEALELLGDASVAGDVEGFLQHPEQSVRQAAIALLAAHARGDLSTMLLRALSLDDEDVRVDLVAAMGEHRLVETRPVLLGLLNKASLFAPDEPAAVQAAACVALGHLAAPEALGPLLEILGMPRSRPATVRAAAASALPHLSTPLTRASITAELQRHAHDPDPLVAAAVRHSMAALDPTLSSAEGDRRLPVSTKTDPAIRWRGTRG